MEQSGLRFGINNRHSVGNNLIQIGIRNNLEFARNSSQWGLYNNVEEANSGILQVGGFNNSGYNTRNTTQIGLLNRWQDQKGKTHHSLIVGGSRPKKYIGNTAAVGLSAYTVDEFLLDGEITKGIESIISNLF